MKKLFIIFGLVGIVGVVNADSEHNNGNNVINIKEFTPCTEYGLLVTTIRRSEIEVVELQSCSREEAERKLEGLVNGVGLGIKGVIRKVERLF